MVKFVQINHNFMNCLKSKVCFGTYTVCPSSRISLQKSFKFSSLLSAFSLVYALLLFNGCSDDPVTAEGYVFETPRFNWRTTEINETGYIDFWAQDTSKMFLLDYDRRSLAVYSGGILNRFSAGNFEMVSMSGISQNEIMVFGISADTEITFIKFNGGGFENYPSGIYIPASYSNTFPACYVSSNEAWICSKKGIARLDGNIITAFQYPDSLTTPSDVFKSANGTMQFISYGTSSGQSIQRIYELQDTAFVKIYEMSIPERNSSRYELRELNGRSYILAYTEDEYNQIACFRILDGYNISEIICMNAGIYAFYGIAGTSFQNMALVAITSQNVYSSTRGILYWDGTVLSRELELPPPPVFMEYRYFINNPDNNTILMMYAVDNKTKLLTGTRK